MVDARHAYERAKSDHCKGEIEKLACQLQVHQNVSIYSSERLDDEQISKDFFKLESDRMCASDSVFKGCTSLNYINMLVHQLEASKSNGEKKESTEVLTPNKEDIAINMSMQFNHAVSVKRCINICLTYNSFKFAAFNNRTQDCFCFKNLTEKFEMKSCDPAVYSYSIYSTGVVGINKQNTYDFFTSYKLNTQISSK